MTKASTKKGKDLSELWQVRADPESNRKAEILANFEGTTVSAIVRRAVIRDFYRVSKEYPEIAEQIRLEGEAANAQ
jgi:hypothetical protein